MSAPYYEDASEDVLGWLRESLAGAGTSIGIAEHSVEIHEDFRLVDEAATSAEIVPTPRLCCILAPALSPFSTDDNLVNPASLEMHRGPGEANGLIYTGKAGFVDLGHLRDLCDLTKHVFDEISAANGSPTVIGTLHGRATFSGSLHPTFWTSVAAAIAFDDSVGHEIITYPGWTPGAHNSAFSPEDLCSNYLGTVLAERAIAKGGSFNPAVTRELSSMISSLDGQTKTESLKAFNQIGKRWVVFGGAGDILRMDYLRRRNFTRIPWKTGHSSESAPPAWITAAMPGEDAFYTYTHTADRTIAKSNFASEIARIKTDAAARYGSDFDKP